MCQNYCEGWFAQRFRRARMGITIMREITPPMTMIPSVDPTSDLSSGSGVVVAWKKNDASVSACVNVARLASDCVKAVRSIANNDARIMMMNTRAVLFMWGKYITRIFSLFMYLPGLLKYNFGALSGWMIALNAVVYLWSIHWFDKKSKRLRVVFLTMSGNLLCAHVYKFGSIR